MVNFCIRKNSVLDLILIDEVQCILTIFLSGRLSVLVITAVFSSCYLLNLHVMLRAIAHIDIIPGAPEPIILA